MTQTIINWVIQAALFLYYACVGAAFMMMAAAFAESRGLSGLDPAMLKGLLSIFPLAMCCLIGWLTGRALRRTGKGELFSLRGAVLPAPLKLGQLVIFAYAALCALAVLWALGLGGTGTGLSSMAAALPVFAVAVLTYQITGHGLKRGIPADG
jgi:hypothetical protein